MCTESNTQTTSRMGPARHLEGTDSELISYDTFKVYLISLTGRNRIHSQWEDLVAARRRKVPLQIHRHKDTNSLGI